MLAEARHGVSFERPGAGARPDGEAWNTCAGRSWIMRAVTRADFHQMISSPGFQRNFGRPPDQQGSRYIYLGGLTTNNPDALLAVEPPNFGEQRFVLRVSGEIVMLPGGEIERGLPKRTPAVSTHISNMKRSSARRENREEHVSGCCSRFWC